MTAETVKEPNMVSSNLSFSEATWESVLLPPAGYFLPRFAVEAELEQGLLKECALDLTDGAMTAVCAYHKNKWKSPAMELFLKILDKHFA